LHNHHASVASLRLLFTFAPECRSACHWNERSPSPEYPTGDRPKAKAGFVNWGEHGWTFAVVNAEGRLYADAVLTDHGCVFIGLAPADTSCQVEVVAPRHVRLTMKRGAEVERIGDIELLEDGVTRTTHHVTPAHGVPYVETTIWEKQSRK
jgi:hypothetical protein